MKLTSRNTHRDIAYFYVGLIISFSISGIFLNHRQDFNPRRYTYESKEIVVPVPATKEVINEAFIAAFSQQQHIDDDVRRFSVEGSMLKISYANHDVQVDIATGKGKIETYKTIPLLGHMTKLHLDTSKWWIYYSDVFGLGMLTIAITGMFIERGKNSFSKRGWKLAVVGIVFPLIFLFIIS
ncbi:PepSY-associated TM helix domain-containing protein [Chryseolinea sp. H1M3-3]|uniref:PepSY-associated TM helix domain-containing protein n=1 Tax=Chryseolinea sp. H1M3-3 TaxID=3034144 RepID=UPI0023ED9ED4|nr:PepSY-associated TM helix domain-containing protein [Chryseolinea sp. H1M3-3]